MNEKELNQERKRSLSEEDIGVSPFESFSDYVQRESAPSLFAELREDTDPDENASDSPNKFATLFQSIPVIPIDEQTKKRQQRKEIISNAAKILVLILSLLFILAIFYKEQQWQNTLKRYNSVISQSKSFPPQYHKILHLKQYQEIKNIQAHSPIQQKVLGHNLSYYMNILTKRRKQPKPYRDIDTNVHKQLPFCLYNHEEDQKRQKQIIGSILQSQYENYIVVIHQLQPQQDQNTVETVSDKRIKKIQYKNHSYFYLKSILLSTCPESSILLFIDSPIQAQALRKFNNLHQNWNMYLTYSQQKNVSQVHSFYLRIFELLDLNDFDHSNKEELDKGNLQLMTLGMLELCMLKSKNINIEGKFIYRDKNTLSYLLVNSGNQKLYKRTPYNALTRLSQDFYLNLLTDRQEFRHMQRIAQQQKQSYIQSAKLSIQKMLKATQLQDLIYLPRNHTLLTQQLSYYDEIYNTKQYLQKQLPFCISILSHNNIPHNRYIKVMLSILRQEYSNYRIVFFDDMSEDQTLNRTIQYMKMVGFDRITYVRNLDRKYATYNILNAGFNFCQEDQIQVLVDGDDELIGGYVLALINGLYQKYPQKWVIYTNFKSNLYQFGQSKPIPKKEDIVANNTRVAGHRLGQLRTFKVKLLRLIPKKYHQTKSGYWLDTVYDDALGHSLFQLASISRIMYVPEICYQYNRQYGDNDDSSQQKLFHRFKVYEYLLGLPPLKEVPNLLIQKADKEMTQIFEKEMSSQTFQVLLPSINQNKT